MDSYTIELASKRIFTALSEQDAQFIYKFLPKQRDFPLQLQWEAATSEISYPNVPKQYRGKTYVLTMRNSPKQQMFTILNPDCIPP